MIILCIIYIYIRIIEIVVMFGLFVIGGRLAWGVRNASSDFNESVSLATTIGALGIIGVILTPLDYLMQGNPDVLLGFRGVGIEIGAFLVIIIQFGSKVLYIYVHEIGSTTMGSSFSGTGSGSGSSSNLKVYIYLFL